MASPELEQWTIKELRVFLTERGVPVPNNYRKDQLVENCRLAMGLSLPSNLSPAQYDTAIWRSKKEKLSLDGGIINLPDPETLQQGWETEYTSLPDLIQTGVENYLDRKNRAIGIKTSGKESLRDGKSLYLSGHVHNVKYHGIGPNVPYSFVQSEVVREVKITVDPYKCWLIVHKDRSTLTEAFCSCPGGLRGTCKHVAALCHYIIERVARGDNATVTERRQVWHAPSKKKTHPPEFLSNIRIQKLQGNCVIEEVVGRSRRFQFDPRSLSDRQPKTVTQLDLEGLRAASGGCAGILAYLPGLPNPETQTSVPAHCSSVEEVEAQTTTTPLPPTLPELSKCVTDNEELFSEVSKVIPQNAVQVLSAKTKDQAQSDLWTQHRVGRVTASKMHKVSRMVDTAGNVPGKTKSVLKDIMNYSPPAYSPAIHWGQYNEKYAIKMFFNKKRKQHKGLKVKDCGLYICDKFPMLAASPDAMVTCNCCGPQPRPLEVKNPYKYRGLTITTLAQQPDSCLEIACDGQVKLKANHSYYTQVQAQLFATGADVGYFALKTVAPYNHFHCEEVMFDPMFMEEVVRKCVTFFKKIVVPELLSGQLLKELQDQEVSSAIPTIVPRPSAFSASEYNCSTCTKECVDEPTVFEEMSIYCDYCKGWFHWVCVQVKGSETFLKRKTMKWICPQCNLNQNSDMV